LRGFVINKVISNYARKNRLNPTVPEKRYGMKYFQESKQAISFFDNIPSDLIFQTFTAKN